MSIAVEIYLLLIYAHQIGNCRFILIQNRAVQALHAITNGNSIRHKRIIDNDKLRFPFSVLHKRNKTGRIRAFHLIIYLLGLAPVIDNRPAARRPNIRVHPVQEACGNPLVGTGKLRFCAHTFRMDLHRFRREIFKRRHFAVMVACIFHLPLRKGQRYAAVGIFHQSIIPQLVHRPQLIRRINLFIRFYRIRTHKRRF